MIRVSSAGIAVGKRLAYDVFDARGRLILPRGKMIDSDAMVELICAEGHRHTRAQKQASVFPGMATIASRLDQIDNDFIARSNLSGWALRVKNLAADLLELADEDPDAAFANIHLEIVHSYSVVHHLMAALVAARLALSLNFDPRQRAALVAAALTHDIGVWIMRKELDASERLSEEQRTRLKRHPLDGAALLKELGVVDAVWLEAVSDHHEYLDGSGYAGKTGDEISPPARILALADAYSAMLRPRAYRERVLAHAALEALYTDASQRYDPYLVEKLIWDMGFYPPGSLLRLVNHEIAVAVRNTPGLLDSPRAAAITDSHGRPLAKPFLRDTGDARFAIIDTLDPALAGRAARLIEQCWTLPAFRIEPAAPTR